MENIWLWGIGLLVPAVLTLAGNIFFYSKIKKRVDKSIEEYKIAYSGIFREKIEIYREILDKTYSLQLKIHRYHVSGDQEKASEIFSDVEKYINYYLKNQPFLSQNMLDQLKKIRAEFQFIFDNSYEYYSLSNVSGIDPKTRTDMTKKFFEVGNKLKDQKTFSSLIDTIITEMRTDLRTHS